MSSRNGISQIAETWNKNNCLPIVVSNRRSTLPLRNLVPNAFKHPNLGGPVVSIASAAFGQINTVTGPRIMQFGLKVRF